MILVKIKEDNYIEETVKVLNELHRNDLTLVVCYCMGKMDYDNRFDVDIYIDKLYGDMKRREKKRMKEMVGGVRYEN